MKKNYEKSRGLAVDVRDNNVDKAMRKFKRMVKNSGILQEYRDNQQYVKPSEKKRLAKSAGRKRWLKEQRKRKEEYGY